MNATPVIYPISCSTRAENWVRDTVDYTITAPDTVQISGMTFKLGELKIKEDLPFRFESIVVFRVESGNRLVEEDYQISRFTDVRHSAERQATEPFEIRTGEDGIVREAKSPFEVLAKIVAMLY